MQIIHFDRQNNLTMHIQNNTAYEQNNIALSTYLQFLYFAFQTPFVDLSLTFMNHPFHLLIIHF